MRQSAGFENAGRKISRNNSALSFPPLPWPSRTLSRLVTGRGQMNISDFHERVPAVAVIRRARAFAGHHGRAERPLRRAGFAERRTIVRLLQTLQHGGRDAFGRLLGGNRGDVEHAFRIVLGEFLADAIAAHGNGSDPAPLPDAALVDL